MADRLTPDVLAGDARFAALAALTQRLGALDLSPLLVYLVDQVNAAALPLLAEQFHVMGAEGFASAGAEEALRQLVRDAVLLHRKKGTPWAVRRALAMIGLGDSSEIIEGGTQAVYNGTVFADGALVYGGASWATYRIIADLGELAGLDGGSGDVVRETAEAWAPVSRYLTGVFWKSDVSDAAPVDESISTAVSWADSDLTPWQKRYDGSRFYDQGALLVYNGATRADGLRVYQGWAANDGGWVAGDEDSVLTCALAWTDSDVARRLPAYDGLTQADGVTDYGDSAPPCEDAPMTIAATRYLTFNGAHRYGTALFDGALRANGAAFYQSGVMAAGNVTTYLEAA